MTIGLAAAIAFVATVLAIYLLRPLCLKVGLVDHPDAIRKRHAVPTPLGGGLGILIGILITSLLVPELHDAGFKSLLYALVPLLIVGMLDDFVDTRTLVQVSAQILAAVLMAYEGGAVIRNLGALVAPDQILVLRGWAIPFTLFCVVGVVNAINMIDGIDGLAGSVVLVALGWFAVAGAMQGAVAETLLAVTFMGAVAGFLVYNLRHPLRARASVFLGDTGSMMLGFVLVWLSIRLTQAETGGLPAMAAVWVLGLPLLDTLSMIVRRLAQKRSPLSADRDHLHYVLLWAGLSHGQTVGIMLLVAMLFGAIGIWAWRAGIPESVLFYGALTVYAVHLAVMSRVWKAMSGTAGVAGAGK